MITDTKGCMKLHVDNPKVLKFYHLDFTEWITVRLSFIGIMLIENQI